MGFAADGALRLSPTDLANHLACPHQTQLEPKVQREGPRRPVLEDAYGSLIREKGHLHGRLPRAARGRWAAIALMRAGRRVGVTSLSHKAIIKLLRRVSSRWPTRWRWAPPGATSSSSAIPTSSPRSPRELIPRLRKKSVLQYLVGDALCRFVELAK